MQSQSEGAVSVGLHVSSGNGQDEDSAVQRGDTTSVDTYFFQIGDIRARAASRTAATTWLAQASWVEVTFFGALFI